MFFYINFICISNILIFLTEYIKMFFYIILVNILEHFANAYLFYHNYLLLFSLT